MYLKYKSLNDLLSRQDMTIHQKRRALRRLRFDSFAHEYLLRMNMMKVASMADETTRGTKIDMGSFVLLVRKYRQHLRTLKAEKVRKYNEAFANVMEKRSIAVGKHDAEMAARRQPYGVLKRLFAKKTGKQNKHSA